MLDIDLFHERLAYQETVPWTRRAWVLEMHFMVQQNSAELIPNGFIVLEVGQVLPAEVFRQIARRSKRVDALCGW